jgi:hypothetical protein
MQAGEEKWEYQTLRHKKHVTLSKAKGLPRFARGFSPALAAQVQVSLPAVIHACLRTVQAE